MPLLVLSDIGRGRSGMSREVCWHCGGQLVWNSDEDYESVYGEGNGIVTFLSCQGCGADVQYDIRFDKEE